MEETIGDFQCGFRKGRSTVDQTFTLRQILEKSIEFGIETHHLFIDFEAAYDSIDRSRLYEPMEELRIPKKLIILVKATMEHTQSQVKTQNLLSDPIKTSSGVRHGDFLASCLTLPWRKL
jgi:sorting nexin-29